MTKKEKIILQIIYDYFKENKTMPSRRILQEKLQFKSVNSITQYLNSLEKKGYLSRNNNKLTINNTIYFSSLKKIKILNTSNSYLEVNLNNKKTYFAFKLNNNYFIKDNIIKNDILIIEKRKTLNNGDLGLFIIDNNYQIKKYSFKDGFYLLTSNDTIILNKVHIIGKVIQIIRNI